MHDASYAISSTWPPPPPPIGICIIDTVVTQSSNRLSTLSSYHLYKHTPQFYNPAYLTQLTRSPFSVPHRLRLGRDSKLRRGNPGSRVPNARHPANHRHSGHQQETTEEAHPQHVHEVLVHPKRFAGNLRATEQPVSECNISGFQPIVEPSEVQNLCSTV